MTIINKVLIFLGSTVILAVVSFIIYHQIELSKQQTAIQTQLVQQQQLIDNMVRSSNQYATKGDINSLIQADGMNLQAIQDNLKQLHATLTAVNTEEVSDKAQTATNLASTSSGSKNPAPLTAAPTTICDGKTITCTNPDKYGYLNTQQNLNLNETFDNTNIPIGSVGFSAWQQNPWNINLAQRQYNLTQVVGTDQNGRNYFYNKFSITIGGKTYDAKIDNAQTKQEFPASTLSWWNPRLYLGINGGINVSQLQGAVIPSLNFGFISYGNSRVNPTFSILQLGLGADIIDRKPQLVINPFNVNMGKILSPLVESTYLGPSLAIGSNGSVSLGAGISVGL